jgi:hypothetical protein
VPEFCACILSAEMGPQAVQETWGQDHHHSACSTQECSKTSSKTQLRRGSGTERDPACGAERGLHVARVAYWERRSHLYGGLAVDDLGV